MKRFTTEEFKTKARAIHGDKYDYSRVVYKNAHTNVEIICKKHGSFYQEPENHLRGQGCTLCNKVEKRQMGVYEFIRRARNVHGNRYDYSKVNYTNSKTKVEIICPEHGSFFQKPEKHLIGQGCCYCCANYPDIMASFIEKANKVHGDTYDYSKVNYVNQHTKVCIIDRDYGEFWQQPIAHLNGEGHPLRKGESCYKTKKANNTLNSSKPADIMFDLLKEKFGEDNVLSEYFSSEYPFSCDFYIKSLNLYIELNAYVTHGGHWFDENNEADRQRLEVLKDRAQQKCLSAPKHKKDNRNLYENIIKVWTGSDLKKREIAIANNLNYVVFWNNDLSDFFDWYDNFDTNPVLKQF